MTNDTWSKTIIAPGSDNYYALRDIPTKERQAIVTILSFFNTIMAVPFTVTDDHVAHHKLQWWQADIIKSTQNTASHPLSTEIASVTKAYHLNHNVLLQFIRTIENLIQNCQFRTEQSLRDFYTYTYGIRERMIAKILSPNAAAVSEEIHHGAYALALVDNLKNIRQGTLKTYVFFSDEETETLGKNKNIVLTRQMSEDLKELISHHIKKIFYHGDMVQNKKNYPALHPLIIRIELAKRWCTLIQEEDFPLFTNHIDLTPLRKWWHTRKIKYHHYHK